MSAVLAWSTGLAAAVWLLGSVRPCSRQRTDVKRAQSWLQGWFRVILLPFAALSAMSLLFAVGVLDMGMAAFLQLLGLLLSIIAVVISLRAKVELGESYAADVQVWGEQELKTRGLYALVRHPIYFATIVMWLGAGLGLMNWLLLAGTVIVVATLWLVTIREEQLLMERFGESYREYQACVPRLFPWRRHHAAIVPARKSEMPEPPDVAKQE